MRFGSRIGIMRDGRLIQTGTAREIVRAPADDYVAAFVAGISPIEVLRAADVMIALDGTGPNLPAAARRIDPDLELSVLAAQLAGSVEPAIVVDAAGRPIGLVDKDVLLRNVPAKAYHG
jgi:glycine betaine/proline transport system ATP-binding protein